MASLEPQPALGGLRAPAGALAPRLERWPNVAVRSRAARALLGAALAACFTPSAARAEMRIDGLSPERPTQLLIFTVRGAGVLTPLVAFQERARAEVEAHMNVRVLSLDETLAKGGAAFQKRLAECRGEPPCLSALVGKVDAKFLLVLTASLVGELRLVGSRLVDLGTLTVLGEAVDEVPSDQGVLDVLPDRIRSSIPAHLWDPFGAVAINVSEPGAQLRVNGRIVGMSPMARLGYLMPGEYRIEVAKEGFLPSSSVVKVERGGEVKLDLTLAEAPRPDTDSSWWIWAGAGAAVVAGAAVAAGVVLSSGGGDPTFCSAVDPSACP